MNVLLIGYGKMGHLIGQSLLKNPGIENLSVMDTRIDRIYTEKGVFFCHDLSDEAIARYDAAFVATPATTHFSVMEHLIRCGLKNIYVEKPALVTMEELDHIQAIQGDCRIATGYILRQSEPANILRDYLKRLDRNGYRLEDCSVVYEKYLPFKAEERTQTDRGVFDETVHIWDLIFNYLGFGQKKCRLIKKHLEHDPERSDRVITAKLIYQLQFEDYAARLRIHSSFLAKQRRRVFSFGYRNPCGESRHITLSFDDEDHWDKLKVTDGRGRVLQKDKAPSLVKLDRQMEEVLYFFKTGDKQNLAALDDAQTVIELLQEAEINQKD